MDSDKVTWLANEIFTAFPGEVTSLKFYTLDCGCIFYQRVFENGALDPHVGIYRDASEGPCDVCVRFSKKWKDRVIGATIVYRPNFQIYT